MGKGLALAAIGTLRGQNGKERKGLCNGWGCPGRGLENEKDRARFEDAPGQELEREGDHSRSKDAPALKKAKCCARGGGGGEGGGGTAVDLRSAGDAPKLRPRGG